MDLILIQILHGVGFAILWMCGLFIIPLLSGSVLILFGQKEELATVTFYIVFVLYIVASAIALILI